MSATTWSYHDVVFDREALHTRHNRRGYRTWPCVTMCCFLSHLTKNAMVEWSRPVHWELILKFSQLVIRQKLENGYLLCLISQSREIRITNQEFWHCHLTPVLAAESEGRVSKLASSHHHHHHHHHHHRFLTIVIRPNFIHPNLTLLTLLFKGLERGDGCPTPSNAQHCPFYLRDV